MKKLNDENFGDTQLGRIRKYCWNLTEYPETSLAARVSRCNSGYHSFISKIIIFTITNILVVCIHQYGCGSYLNHSIRTVHNARADWWYWHDSVIFKLYRRSTTSGEMGKGIKDILNYISISIWIISISYFILLSSVLGKLNIWKPFIHLMIW